MVITLNPLLKVSAGQWNTLVNFASALCGLADQICIGANTLPATVTFELARRQPMLDPAIGAALAASVMEVQVRDICRLAVD